MFITFYTLRHDNGVTVTRKETVRNKLNQDLVDIDWLLAFLETPSADAVSISIDHRKLVKTDRATANLLSAVRYEEIKTVFWAVTISNATNA